MSNYMGQQGYLINGNLRGPGQPLQANFNPMMNFQPQNNQQNNNK